MSIGRTIEESLLNAVRSLEVGAYRLHLKKFDDVGTSELLEYIKSGRDDRIFAIAELIRRHTDLGVIANETQIDMLFLDKIKNITDEETALRNARFDAEELRCAKRMGFSDRAVSDFWDCTEEEIYNFRAENKILPVYKMIDTCAAEFDGYIPYFILLMRRRMRSDVSDGKKIIVLGSGPIRIGQGVEFDYSTVHAVKTIKASGFEAIIINNNPETVSTDYTISDKLYFEPLTVEDVMSIIDLEKPQGVIASLGGQTAINLADKLQARGVKIIGTDSEAIDRAENRDLFEKVLEQLGIPQPNGTAVTRR